MDGSGLLNPMSLKFGPMQSHGLEETSSQSPFLLTSSANAMPHDLLSPPSESPLDEKRSKLEVPAAPPAQPFNLVGKEATRPPPLLPPSSACFPLSLLYGQPNSYLFVGSTPFMPLPHQQHPSDLSRGLLFPGHPPLHGGNGFGLDSLKEKACLDFARTYHRTMAKSPVIDSLAGPRPPLVPLCGGLQFPTTSAFDKWRPLDFLKDDKLRQGLGPTDGIDSSGRTTSGTPFSEPAESPKSIDLNSDINESTPSRWDNFFRLFSSPARSKWTAVPGQVPCCPVCGITLTHSQIAEHFQLEMEKLHEFYSSRRWLTQERQEDDPTDQHLDRLCGPPPSYGPGDKRSPLSRWETYLKVRANRHHRLNVSAARPNVAATFNTAFCGRNKRKSPEDMAEAISSGSVPLDLKIEGRKSERSPSQLSHSPLKSDAPAELKVEISESYLHDGTPEDPSSDQVPRDSTTPSEGVMVPKFSPISPGMEKMDDNNFAGESEVQDGESNNHSEKNDPSGNSDNGAEKGGFDKSPPKLSPESSSGESVVRWSSKDGQRASLKCVVCMEPYTKPVVSICCWHVHCERCWLKSLGAKRLCPQCDTITCPSDLRKIHL